MGLGEGLISWHASTNLLQYKGDKLPSIWSVMQPLRLEKLESLPHSDLSELCDATKLAIEDGGGFGWLHPPAREVLERYWRGVLLIPERALFVARLDGVIAGSAQLARATPNNQAQEFMGHLHTFFVAPWARGKGLATELIKAVEKEARVQNCEVLILDVRESQTHAAKVFTSLGYQSWGRLARYAKVDDQWIPGCYYYKDL